MRRRWTSRVAVAVGLLAVVLLVLQVAGFDPVPARVVLIGAVCAAATWVTLDVLVDAGPGWEVDVAPAVPEPSADPRLATYRRMLDSHRQGAGDDPAVRDALTRLARRSLARRHHLAWDDPVAGQHVHPDLRILLGAQRPLRPAEIERCLHHIEEI